MHFAKFDITIIMCRFSRREREYHTILLCVYFFHFRNVDIFNVEICTVDPRYLDFDYLE